MKDSSEGKFRRRMICRQNVSVYIINEQRERERPILSLPSSWSIDLSQLVLSFSQQKTTLNKRNASEMKKKILTRIHLCLPCAPSRQPSNVLVDDPWMMPAKSTAHGEKKGILHWCKWWPSNVFCIDLSQTKHQHIHSSIVAYHVLFYDRHRTFSSMTFITMMHSKIESKPRKKRIIHRRKWWTLNLLCIDILSININTVRLSTHCDFWTHAFQSMYGRNQRSAGSPTACRSWEPIDQHSSPHIMCSLAAAVGCSRRRSVHDAHKNRVERERWEDCSLMQPIVIDRVLHRCFVDKHQHIHSSTHPCFSSHSYQSVQNYTLSIVFSSVPCHIENGLINVHRRLACVLLRSPSNFFVDDLHQTDAAEIVSNR